MADDINVDVNVTVNVVDEVTTVTISPDENIIVQVSEATQVKVTTIAEQGPPGRDGTDGVDGTGQRFEQSSPLSVWIIQHTLNKYPTFTVVDSAGNLIIGSPSYDSLSQLTLTFSAPFGGVAYLI